MQRDPDGRLVRGVISDLVTLSGTARRYRTPTIYHCEPIQTIKIHKDILKCDINDWIASTFTLVSDVSMGIFSKFLLKLATTPRRSGGSERPPRTAFLQSSAQKFSSYLLFVPATMKQPRFYFIPSHTTSHYIYIYKDVCERERRVGCKCDAAGVNASTRVISVPGSCTRPPPAAVWSERVPAPSP